MRICPICQSENQLDARSCYYCGASLTERRQKAPSRPTPVLSPRPQSHHNPLDDFDMATIPRTTPPLAQQAGVYETPVQDHVPALFNGGALTIDEDELEIGVEELDYSEAQDYTPRLVLGASQMTIDETVDGLALLDLETPPPELEFAHEPSLEPAPGQSARPKLTDLGGHELSMPPSLYDQEPSLSTTLQPSAISLGSYPEGSPTIHPTQALPRPHSAAPRSLAKGLATWGAGCGAVVIIIWSLGLWELVVPVERHAPVDRVGSTTLGHTPLKVNIKPSELLNSTTNVASPEPQRSLKTSPRSEITSTAPQRDSSITQSAPQSPTSLSTVVSREQAQKPQKSSSRAALKRSTGSAKNSSKSSTAISKPKSSKKRGAASLSALLRQGEKLLTQGRVAQARAVFQRAHQLDPRSPTPIAQLGWCDLDQRRYTSAVQQFKRALAVRPRHSDSLYGLGYVYDKLKNQKQARHYFSQYKKHYPRGNKISIIDRKLSALAE